MRKLELDFVRARKPSAPAAWLLLALSLAFLMDVGYSWIDLRNAVARNEARLKGPGNAPSQSLQRVASAQPLDSATENEVRLARDTVRKLSMPWDHLLRSLEAAQTESATLIAIEPDPESGNLLLTGEAKNYLGALTYLANLDRQPELSEVHLLKHEVRGSEAGRPVSFIVSAKWKQTR
ncbi:MAG: hypothetical protein IPK29_15300 [Betaproteobacteria bacterium]|nr:hypothetical protein [Betaproteobacteria bacterium]